MSCPVKNFNTVNFPDSFNLETAEDRDEYNHQPGTNSP
jgi:hypothetical protein